MASVLAKPALNFVMSKMLVFRTGKRAVANAAKDGRRISLKSLRFSLRGGATARAIRTGKEPDRAAAVLELSPVEITLSDGAVETDGDYLFELLLRARAEVGKPNDAVLAMSDQQVHRQHVAASTSPPRPKPIISPVMAARADQLRATNGEVIDRILSALTSAGSRRELLRDWALSRPTWIEDDAVLIGWLAQLAFDAGEKAAARTFVTEALNLGASPRAYWKVLLVSTWTAMEQNEGLDYIRDEAEHPLIRASLRANSPLDRRAALATWTPSTAPERAMKVALDLEVAIELGLLDEAIEIGTRAFTEDHFAGAGIVAVKALLRRTFVDGFRLHTNDANDARELAIRIRDALRTWGSDSTPPVTHAIHASLMLADHERAWSLSQPDPEGEATTIEAAAPAIADMAVIMLAERGRIDEAVERLNSATSTATRAQVRAIEAEYLGELDRANLLWSEAIGVIDDWQQKTAIALRLAIRGVQDPFLEELRLAGNEEVVSDLILITDVANQEPGALGRARAAARHNAVLAHALVNCLERVDRPAELIPLLEETADRWGDADLWLRAARAYGRQREWAQAIDRANRALTTGGNAWGDRASAHIVIVEASSALEQWDIADIAARALLNLQTDRPSAQWAYVLVAFWAGREDDAYARWQEFTPRPSPRTINETAAWLAFFRGHGRAVGSVEDVLGVIRLHPGSEDVRRVGILSLLQAPADTVEAPFGLGELIERFRADFPESDAFTQVRFEGEDAESILDALDALRGTDVDYTPLEDGLRNGTLPVGAVAHIVRRSYAEVLVTREKAPRFAGQLQQTNVPRVSDLFGTDLVIDTSALLTLTHMSAETANEFRATFARLLATSGQLLDANAARESLRHTTGGHFFPTTAATPRRFEQSDPEQEQEQRDLIEALVAQFSLVDRVSHRELSEDTKSAVEMFDGPWLIAMDYAKMHNLPLWSDDLAQRQIAEHIGVYAIGTPEILDALRGTSAPLDFDLVEAQMIHNYIVGLDFRKTVWHVALELDAFRVGGTALAIRYGGAQDLEAKTRLVLEAMGRCTDDPTQLEHWARLLWAVVTEAAGSDDAADGNAVTLAREVIRGGWCTETTFPFIVHGWKAATPSRFATSFQLALRSIYRPAAERFGWDRAADFVLRLCSGLDATERTLALSVVLER